MDHFVRPGLRFDCRLGTLDAPAVVLLHGFPQQPFSFDAVASRLNAAGLRTLTPTQRGYTPAARPTRRRNYRTAATAADVVGLLDTAGLAQAHIVGHDWGGNQAWGVAGWHADRVASLTVVSTPPCGVRQVAVDQQTGPALVVHGVLSNCRRCRIDGPGPFRNRCGTAVCQLTSPNAMPRRWPSRAHSPVH